MFRCYLKLISAQPQQVVKFLPALNCRLACRIFQTLHAVLYPLGLQNLNGTDKPGITHMSAAARLHVIPHLEHPYLLTRRHTALVQHEPELLLGFDSVHPGDLHRNIGHHCLVGNEFYLLEFFIGDAFEMRQVQACPVCTILGASLPDMVTQHILGGIVHYMGGSMVAHMCQPSLSIHSPVHSIPWFQVDNVLGNRM